MLEGFLATRLSFHMLVKLDRFLTKQGKMTIYNSFIVSNFNYCPLAWHFCSASSTNNIEKNSREGFKIHQQRFHVISGISTDFYKDTLLTCKEDEANGF